MCVFTASQPHENHFCQKLIQKADALNAWGFLIYLLPNFWEETSYNPYQDKKDAGMKATWMTVFTEKQDNKYLGSFFSPNSTSEIKQSSQEKICPHRNLCITAQALWAFSSVQWTDGGCYKLFKPVFTANLQAICHGFLYSQGLFKFLERD